MSAQGCVQTIGIIFEDKSTEYVGVFFHLKLKVNRASYLLLDDFPQVICDVGTDCCGNNQASADHLLAFAVNLDKGLSDERHDFDALVRHYKLHKPRQGNGRLLSLANGGC